MTTDNYYAILDIESTGVDPKDDPILEIAMVIVDEGLVIKHTWSARVAPDNRNWKSRMSEFVQEMHSGSGLLAEIDHFALPLAAAETEAISVLENMANPGDFILTGSGVSHYDRRVLEEQMPELASWFKYYNIDVGVARRLLRDICGRSDLLLPEEPKPHRALDDCIYHLRELRFVRNALARESVAP